MTPLNFPTALLAPLAAVLIAHPAAGAASHPVAPSQNGERTPDGREPFAIRFSGFLPVEYLKFAPKREEEPEIRLGRSLPASAQIGESPEWKQFSQGMAQVGGGSGSFASANSTGASGTTGSADGHRHRGKAGGKTAGKGDDQTGEPDAIGDVPNASPALASVPVTPVPEPSAALFGVAVLSACGFSRRRFK